MRCATVANQDSGAHSVPWQAPNLYPSVQAPPSPPNSNPATRCAPSLPRRGVREVRSKVESHFFKLEPLTTHCQLALRQPRNAVNCAPGCPELFGYNSICFPTRPSPQRVERTTATASFHLHGQPRQQRQPKRKDSIVGAFAETGGGSGGSTRVSSSSVGTAIESSPIAARSRRSCSNERRTRHPLRNHETQWEPRPLDNDGNRSHGEEQKRGHGLQIRRRDDLEGSLCVHRRERPPGSEEAAQSESW